MSPTSTTSVSSVDDDEEELQPALSSGSLTLGGGARTTMRAVMQPKSLRIPREAVGAAQVQLSRLLLGNPTQVTLQEPFHAVHRLFTGMCLTEACVCHFGELKGILTKQGIVDCMRGYHGWTKSFF